MSKMSVAVAGAGIGGLAFARAMQMFGHKVTVFERSPKIMTRGGSISVMSGIRVMEELKLTAPFESASNLKTTFAISSDAHDCEPVVIPIKGMLDMRRINRKCLVQVLADSLEEGTIRYGTTAEEISPSGTGDQVQVSVRHADSAEPLSERYDLVIGADGIHSSVRKECFPAAKPAHYTGYQLLMLNRERGAIPDDSSRPISMKDEMRFRTAPGVRAYAIEFTAVRGDDGIGCDGAGIIFPAAEPVSDDWDNVLSSREEFLERARPFVSGPDDHLIKLIKGSNTIWHWGAHAGLPLTSWGAHGGRVILLGDAAHATAPSLGQGSNMALDDAWVLANTVEKHLTGGALTSAACGEVLAEYEGARKAACEGIVASSEGQTGAFSNVGFQATDGSGAIKSMAEMFQAQAARMRTPPK